MKQNIAIIIPELAGGGAERVVSNLSLYFPEEFKRYIIVYDKTNISYPYNGHLIDLNTRATRNPFGKAINLIKRIFKIRKIKKEYKIDTTISFMEGPNIVNILTKSEDKVIVSVRNFISKSANGFYGKIYKKLIMKFYNKADCIISVSKTIKDDLIKNFKINEEKIEVIYNPYDIETIQKLTEEELEEEYKEIFNQPVIINVGRLYKQKGQWHLIRAFKKVKEEIPNSKLVILGQGNLEEYLRKLVYEYRLEKDIYLLGFQKNPFKFMSRSEICAFSSLYEGFPNVLVEAMACGLPVIASDCKSGPREIMDLDTNIDIETKTIEYAEYGILVPVCDGVYYCGKDDLSKEEKLLAKAITNIFKDEEIKNSYIRKAKVRASNFNINNIISQWIEQIKR